MRNQRKRCTACECVAIPIKSLIDDVNRYGAAYKRAQRSSDLHNVALNAFKSAMPEVPEASWQAYLAGIDIALSSNMIMK